MSAIISTMDAPSAIGPYSQAVTAGNLLFTSGQLPVNPETGQLVEDDIGKQTKQVMDNIVSVLNAGGTSLAKSVKVTCFLADMNDFPAFNEIYGNYFSDHKPARSCVAVRTLPKNVKVEIDVIAEI